MIAEKFDPPGREGCEIGHRPRMIPVTSGLAKTDFSGENARESNMEEIMSEHTEEKIAGKKFESSTEHAKKALDAAAEASRAVSNTVKRQAQVAYETGKEHITAAAKDLGEAASATYEDLRGQAKIKADAYKDKAQAAWGDASSRAQTYQSDTESYIRENPLKAVGIAVGVGFLLGVIFRR